jgi:hypothetical protein
VHLLYARCRLPAAYRLALAECARRAAWQEMFAGQAALKACLWLTMVPDMRLLCIFCMRGCRLPAAFRLAPAECARRAAWQEMSAGQAALKACLWFTILPDRQLLCIFCVRAAGSLLRTA